MSDSVNPATQPDRSTAELATYSVLAYAISWVLWLPVLIGRRVSPVYLSLGTYGPTLAALATHRIFCGNWRAARIWSRTSRVVVGTALGVASVLTAAFTAAFFMTQSGFDRWAWPALLQIPMLLLPNLLGGPLGEEAGWRGFALPGLQRLLSPVSSALLLGVVWAQWHLPLIVTHVYNVSWWQFTLMTMAASVFLSIGFNRSGGSTAAAVLVHGVYNVGTGIILNDVIGPATLYNNDVQHNVLWMAYLAVAAGLCVLTNGRLGYQPAPAHGNDVG